MAYVHIRMCVCPMRAHLNGRTDVCVIGHNQLCSWLATTRACLSVAVVGRYCCRAYRLPRFHLQLPGYRTPARCSIYARSSQLCTFPWRRFSATVLPLAASISRLPYSLCWSSERSWKSCGSCRSHSLAMTLSMEQSADASHGDRSLAEWDVGK